MIVNRKLFLPLVILLVVFTAVFIIAQTQLAKWGLDHLVLSIANLLFFFITVLTLKMQQKALANSNPNVFIRSVMSGMLIKMFVCVIAVVAYRLIAGDQVSKATILTAVFLYILYLGVEVSLISKLNRQKNG